MLKRKADDASFKEAWLEEQSDALFRLRYRNTKAREDAKENIRS